MKAFEYELKMKEIDQIRRPYTVRNAMSICFQSSIIDFWQPDPKADDKLMEDEEEPRTPPMDNFA